VAVFGGRRTPVGFSNGFATGEASMRADLWNGLTCAWAALLGFGGNQGGGASGGDPTKVLFGPAPRPGTVGSNGGQVGKVGKWGATWRLSGGGSNSVSLCNSNDAIGASEATYIVGIRHDTVDAVLNGTIIGLGGTTASMAQILIASSTQLELDWGGNTAGNQLLGTYATGLFDNQEHVVAMSVGNLGGMRLFIDGVLIASKAYPGVRSTVNFAARLGNLFTTAAGVNYSFAYIWNRQLDDSAITEVSTDPYLPFRPKIFVEAKSLTVFAELGSAITGSAAVAADLGLLVNLGSGITGGAALAADSTAAAPLAASIAGSGAVAGSVGLLENLNAGISGAGALAANLTGNAPMSAAIQGHAVVAADLSGAPPAFTAEDGGLGRDPLGDPLGGGGPLHVVRARAIEGQTVRVVFDEEPLHQGAAGLNDALNPSNYSLSIIDGVGAIPLAVGVKPQLVPGPAAAVGGNEWGVDVQTDRQLIIGLTYQIAVGLNVQAKAGDTVAAPGTAPFVGIVKLADTGILAVRASFADFDNPPARGSWFVDDSGDITVAGGIASLQKRIIRRLTTPKGAFKFLPSYGLALQLKETASLAQVAALKLDATQQLRQEPEVAAAAVTATIAGNNVLTIQATVRTKVGAVVEAGIQVTLGQQGFTVI